MENDYFFDTYAIIETLKGSENYFAFSDKQIITSTNNLVEFYYYLLRERGGKVAKEIIFDTDFIFLDITEEIAVESAVFRYNNKGKEFSYIDCIGYITALKNNLKFLTGDKDFNNFKNVEFVK